MALNFLKENMKIRTFLCSSTKLVGQSVAIISLISVIERQIMKKEAQRHGIVSTFAQLFI